MIKNCIRYLITSFEFIIYHYRGLQNAINIPPSPPANLISSGTHLSSPPNPSPISFVSYSPALVSTPSSPQTASVHGVAPPFEHTISSSTNRVCVDCLFQCMSIRQVCPLVDSMIVEPRFADPVSLVFYKKILITKSALSKIEELLA